MAKKKSKLKTWIKENRVTQEWVSIKTGIAQGIISGYCNNKKVSDISMVRFWDTAHKTGIPEDVIFAIRDQHL